MAGRKVQKFGDIMMKQSLAIVDPAVEEYEAQAPGEVRTPVREDSLKRDELPEKQPETSEGPES